MTDISEQLTEKAAKRFDESLDLIQVGKLEEALESLQKAEKAAYEAENDAVLLHILKLRGKIMESLGRLEDALETYTFALNANEELLETDPENELYLDLLQMNLNSIGNLGNNTGERATPNLRNRVMKPASKFARRDSNLSRKTIFTRCTLETPLTTLENSMQEWAKPKKQKKTTKKPLKSMTNSSMIIPETWNISQTR